MIKIWSGIYRGECRDEKKTKMSGERERGRIKERKGATEEESRASSQYRLSLGLLTVFAPRNAEVKRG